MIRLRQGDKHVGMQEAQQQQRGRALHVEVDEGVLSVKLPPDQLAVVQQALETIVETLPEDQERDFFATRDALVQMAKLALAKDEGQEASAAHQVLVQVDASALDGQGGESDYPLPTVK